MRIVGELPHPRLKITLMHHGRYLLKLEDVDAELTYRFRDGEGVRDLESAQRALDLGLMQEAERALVALQTARRQVGGRLHEPGGASFPEII